MRNIKRFVESVLDKSLKDAFPQLPYSPVNNLQTVKNDFDFQMNNLVALFNKNKASPHLLEGCTTVKEMAERFLTFVPKDDFEKIEIMEKGFISFAVSSALILSVVKDVVDKPVTYKSIAPAKVLIDYSSPNIAKEMHVGHLRSTILGEATSRILEFLGHDIERVNHVGDWGTQFGMLIEYIKELHPNFLEEDVPLTDLNSFYKAAKTRFDADEDFKKRAQENVYKLQTLKEPFARQAWRKLCDISEKEFKLVYDRLDASKKLQYRGESFYNEMIPEVIEKVKPFLEVVDGATCWFTDGKKKKNETPLMIVKSDGGFGYDTTDLAAAYHRLVENKKEWVLYFTDVGQEPHFKLIFKAAEQAGWTNNSSRLMHLGFGLVLGDDGKKFKTRSGDVVKLVDLLDEAVDKARTELTKRFEQMSEEDKALCDIEEVSKAVGYGAVKYFDLRTFRTTNYKFSYDSMLDYNGNTAVYLLYAYARICSIFRKTGKFGNRETDLGLNPADLVISQPEERQLLRMLTKFPEVMDAFEKDMHVHRVCDYLYELSTTFTTFFSRCRVVGDPNEASRLIISDVTRKVMGLTMNMLGITPVTRL